MKSKNYTTALFCAFFSLSLESIAQVNFFNIVNSPLDTILCNENCIQLSTQHLDIRKTNSYSSISIPFTVDTFNSSTLLNINENKFSDTIFLGFEFCFYGNVYEHCYASSNGHLTFNDSFRLSNATIETQHPLPYYNTVAFPDNAIFLPFADFDMQAGGTVKYATIGAYPYRKFILRYDSISFYTGGTCASNATSSMRCVLNETYNTIDIYIASKPECNTDTTYWLNYATLGVQSIGASSYYTVPGKNASIWTVSNEAWSIFPNSLPGTKVSWYDEGGNLLLANSDTFNFCSTFFPRIINAITEYECPYKVFYDTIKIIKLMPEITNTLIDSATCQNTSDGSITVFGTSYYPPNQFNIDGGLFTNSNVFSNLAWGYHSIYMKDSLGCFDTLEIFIGVKSNLAVYNLDIDTPICNQSNGKICDTAIGGIFPYSYLWNTGDTTLCISNLPSGNYSFTVTDFYGCEAYHQVFLPDSNSPTLTAILTHAVCDSNGAIDISVSNGVYPYMYQWGNGDTTQDISGLSQGIYTLIVTDSIGCTFDTIFYLQNNQVVVSLYSLTNTTCGLNNGLLSVVANYGSPPYTFAWSNGANTAINNNLAAGSYTCVVTDANGCTNFTILSLLPSNPIDISFAVGNALCTTLDNGEITPSINNAILPLSYVWSNSETTSVISGLVPGWYSLTVTDFQGCQDFDSVYVGIDGIPSLHILNFISPFCYGDHNGSMTFEGINGAPPYLFSVNGINISTTTQLNGISSGWYTFTIRDGNSCTRDTAIFLSQPDQLIISSLYADTNACYDDINVSLFVNASGGTPPYQFQINSKGWQSIHEFSPLAKGNYFIEVKDAHNCISMSNYEVLGPQEPLSFLKNKQDLDCYIENSGMLDYTILGGWPPYVVAWEHSISTSTKLDGLDIGIYKIYITDNLGCQIEDTTIIGREACCHVYFPNAFSPNHDGRNDYFKPISIKDIRAISMKIYDRWGNLVFESHDYNKGWDGTIKGAKAESDTYFYLVKYICNITSRVITMKGDIMITR